MPYTHREEKTLEGLRERYGPDRGYDIFNKMRAKGSLGQSSKKRMFRRAAEARKGKKSHHR